MQVIGDLLFGLGFFVAGCILLFAFSTTICDAVEHYIDGLFLFVLCQLLSVMMVYKVRRDAKRDEDVFRCKRVEGAGRS